MLPTADAQTMLLINVHAGLRTPEPGETTLVHGNYQYWHYVCDGFDDRGWGCGYRTLQTLCSWMYDQCLGQRAPTIPEIQKLLVDMQDKPVSFVGSKLWIGTFEACLILELRYMMAGKIIHVPKGKDLIDHIKTIENHFLKCRCPIMMGGKADNASKGIVGIHVGMQNTYLLVVDPHFVGDARSNEQLQRDGWVRWQSINDFDQNSFYNICLPQFVDHSQNSGA